MKAWSPRGFLAGMALAVVGCAILGWSCSGRNMFHDFVRLTFYTGAESLFYPTASQLRNIVLERCPLDRTVIVVGGDSVFNGYGQPTEGIWTSLLERELGSEFCVVNLAAVFERMTDLGAVVVNMLSDTYERIFLVANTSAATCGPPDGGSVYRYVFWDAYYKGLLTQRDEMDGPIERALESRPADPELFLKARLDSVLYFTDLWQWITYEYVSTVWSWETRASPLRPRRSYPVPVPTIVPSADRLAKVTPVQAKAYFDQYSAHLFSDDGRGGWVERAEAWSAFEREIADALPPKIRRRTLVVLNALNAGYRRKVSVPLRQRERLATDATIARFRAAGYYAVAVGYDFVPDDFLDLTHMTPSGGAKLAHAVAGATRLMVERSAGATQ
jgi:hypothetical protein